MYSEAHFKTHSNFEIASTVSYQYPKFHSFRQNQSNKPSEIYEAAMNILNDLIMGTKRATDIFTTYQKRRQQRESSIQRNNKIEPKITSKNNLYRESLKNQTFNSFSIATSGFSMRNSQIFEDINYSFESQFQLTKQNLKALFSPQDQNILILAIGLICRYVVIVGKPLKPNQILKLCAVSGIISYKISEDNEISGLVQYFSNVLNVPQQNLYSLEKEFLKMINYDINITGKSLHNLMIWFY